MNETTDIIVLFALIPLAAALISAGLVNQRWLSRAVGLASFAACAALGLTMLVRIHMAEGAILVSHLGGWRAPMGIPLIFDSFSGLLLVTASVVAVGCYLHSFSTLEARTERRYFHPLIQSLMFGVNLSLLTGDLFNLFVAFEIMLMASYALMCIGGTHKQLRQAYKYVLLNVIASTIFLLAAGMAYGMFGTLNLADMARIVHEAQVTGEDLPTGFAMLGVTLAVVFGMKAAIFPMWFWLPDTYYTIPTAISALFSGTLTKVGVYALARILSLVFTQNPPDGADPLPARDVLLIVLGVSAAFTMFYGVLGAVSQHNIRKILSIHVISQIGYMIFAIVVMTGHALAGLALFVIHNMVVKSSLFLCCGIMERHGGGDDLDQLGGLLKRAPWLAVMFFLAAMSLVGLPPLSGFFGKLVIVIAGWDGYWWLVLFALATTPLTLLSMLKIWSYGFWNPMPAAVREHPAPAAGGLRLAYAGTAMLVVVALFLGFGAEPVYRVALVAGEQMAHPAPYIEAVLGPEALEVEAVTRDGAEPLPELAEDAR